MKFVPAVKNKDRKGEGGKGSEHLELRCEIRERGHKGGLHLNTGRARLHSNPTCPLSRHYRVVFQFSSIWDL